MTINIFRLVTGVMVVIWLAGCIRDAIYLDIVRADWADWTIILGVFGFTLAGGAVIFAVAWGMGRIVRRALRVPIGRDFRHEDQAQ